ncbi:MAG: OmpA family protein [Alphaproteobacteria bacterium]|nr:OmpA family protein [Alphaproteobacteria bacterium]PHY01347.1 MAG: hypothetical protein CK529_00290 [Rhodospirillaceae bacterium]
MRDITEARTRLMAVLTDDNRKALPAQASLAQTAVDCWMEQQEENFQPKDIEACKSTFNSSALTPEARKTVTDIGAAYKKYNPSTVMVVGHTDTSGVGDSNIVLSQKRAETVANALTKEGVSQNKMRIEAYGEERPTVKSGDGVKEQKNRRVDVVFEK